MTVAVILLLVSFWHHTPKHKPVTPAQKSFLAEVKEDEKYVEDAKEGVRAFEADTQYSQFERPELDRFEHQLYLCILDEQNKDLVGLVTDATLLDEYGTALNVLDKDLHHENVI